MARVEHFNIQIRSRTRPAELRDKGARLPGRNFWNRSLDPHTNLEGRRLGKLGAVYRNIAPKFVALITKLGVLRDNGTSGCAAASARQTAIHKNRKVPTKESSKRPKKKPPDERARSKGNGDCVRGQQV